MEAVISIAGIADSAARGVSKIWQLTEAWRNAPKEIYQLRDDLDQLADFYEQTRQGIEVAYRELEKLQPQLKEKFQRLLAASHKNMLELESIVDRVKDASAGDRGVNHKRRLLWIMRAQKVSYLRQVSRDMMMQVFGMLITLNISISTLTHESIRLSNEKVASNLNNSSVEPTTVEPSIEEADDIQSLSRAATLVDMTNEEDLVSSSIESTKSYHKNISKQEFNNKAFEYIHTKLLAGPEHNDQMLGNIDDRLHQDNPYQSLPFRNTGIAVTSSAEKYAKTIDEPFSFQTLERQLSKGPKSLGCEAHCRCSCHSATRSWHWSLASLSSILGSVTVAYVGAEDQGGLKHCDSSKCTRNMSSSMRILYRVPSWMTPSAMSLFYCRSMFGAPELLLRTFRVVEDMSFFEHQTLFSCISSNDVKRARALLDRKLTTASEIHAEDGRTPLHDAIYFGNVDMVRLLLQAGCDPWLSSDLGTVAISYAFQKFAIGSNDGRQYAELFDFSTYLEEHEFSDLHKIAAGVLPQSLEDILEKPSFIQQVDKVNTIGWTPLHYAAMRGDTVGVRALLRAGADVGARSPNGACALSLACSFADLPTIKTLISAGADVLAGPKRNPGLNAMYRAANSSRDEPEVLDLLLRHGADIENRDSVLGETTLSQLFCYDRHLSVRYLLSKGASVNNIDSAGVHALADAIARRAHRCVPLLLEHGTNYRYVNCNGQGVLHMLALWGDVEMCHIFRDFGMRGVDTNLRDKTGKTPLQLFGERQGTTPELEVAFTEVLVATEAVNMNLVEDIDSEESADESDEEFFDTEDA